ncbi:protein GVQW3-like [Mercenaria mercenaria]|uniref:protein GVQW3-like n=1 Tax=Mercenaria mercenaria TaxID=6596 RepID=UPI00234F2817|nr:protein GVQW3-like [Mercenaria mercenaria]
MAGFRSSKWLEIRTCIKARSHLGLSARDLFAEICDIYGHHEVSYSTVTRWISHFKSGREQLQDLPRSGRPKSVTTDKYVKKIKQLLEKDARLTLRELARLTGISSERVYSVLKEKLKVTKISARWIRHLLTPQQKRERVKKAKSLLKLYSECKGNAFTELVTGDET